MLPMKTINIYIYIISWYPIINRRYFRSNYSDLTRPHPKFSKGNPLHGNLGGWNIIPFGQNIYRVRPGQPIPQPTGESISPRQKRWPLVLPNRRVWYGLWYKMLQAEMFVFSFEPGVCLGGSKEQNREDFVVKSFERKLYYTKEHGRMGRVFYGDYVRMVGCWVWCSVGLVGCWFCWMLVVGCVGGCMKIYTKMSMNKFHQVGFSVGGVFFKKSTRNQSRYTPEV